MRYKKRTLLIVIIILLMIFIITYPVIFTWSPMCCSHEDVDINTGRIRYIRYLLYCKISEKVENSILTETIVPFDEDTQPNWKRVNTFSPGVKHSPHHGYHGAINQIRHVEIIWKLYSFTDDAKKHIAQTVLDKWQADGKYFSVSEYLLEVSKMCDQKKELDPNATISVADLSTLTVE
ncbi:MAG: hypothetical protein JW715_12390 [Sedimentisphaerales bacterium]|nr:hypothetical protein [Sedimentisphaerales bacterium]